MAKTWGPTILACEQVHADKYRQRGENFREAMQRVSSALADNDDHYYALREILLEMRFMPAGRIQAAMGSTRVVTPYNCFVSGTIEDSYTRGHGSIMERAKDAADTMRLGGGIGYDFSTIRPRGELIKTLDSQSSGPVSFMPIYDAVGLATASSGHRRGAQMGVLRVDHPDIEEFVRAKQNTTSLTGFNISVAVTDAFMRAVVAGTDFDLKWGNKVYRTIDARTLWETIMRSNYDWSEPGVLFIDRINEWNNLYYCETIAATNPCGEQPLPPYGACLLGSFNLVKYLSRPSLGSKWSFDFDQFYEDIPAVVRAMDNVIDRARYPMHEQEQEAIRKRRMGLGVTGVANCIEALGHPYASEGFLTRLNAILEGMKNACYKASAQLAKEKGPFPLFSAEPYLNGRFISTLSYDARELVEEYGIRNSHLLSIAPTGTISFAADNISSGIEPVYAHHVRRTINTFEGPKVVEIADYGVAFLGVEGRTAEAVTAEEHIAVLATCARHIDSAVSKTCNVPNQIEWERFKMLYIKAWEQGCKGCTTARQGNLRMGPLQAITQEGATEEDLSCEIDPVSGRRSCE